MIAKFSSPVSVSKEWRKPWFVATKIAESLLQIKAIKLQPDYEKPYNNLGNLLSELGKYDEANDFYLKTIKIKPDHAKAYSNLLFNYNYMINYDPNLYLSYAKKYRLNCKSIKKNLSFKYQYEKNPKKLKLGFVSADFGNHPGGFFTLSTLRELRKRNFELVAYSTNDRNDEFSPHFRPLFSKWHSIEKKDDEEVVGGCCDVAFCEGASPNRNARSSSSSCCCVVWGDADGASFEGCCFDGEGPNKSSSRSLSWFLLLLFPFLFLNQL